MLERLAARLNRRGFVLSHARTPSLSRSRMLHSTFWVHGGETLLLEHCQDGCDGADNLHDAFFSKFKSIASLLCIQIDQFSKFTTSQFDAANRPVSDLYSMSAFGLDFLYPPKALALLQRLSVRSNRRRMYGRVPPCFTRLYSSFVGDSAKASRARRDRPVLPRDKEYDYAVSGMDKKLIHRRKKGAIGEWTPGPRGDGRTLQSYNPAIYDLSDGSFDQAWAWFNRTPGAPSYPLMILEPQSKRRRFLFGYLTNSKRQVDQDRTIELLEALDPSEFRLVDYRYLVKAYLSKDRLDSAAALLSQLMEATLGNSHAGIEDYLAYCIKNGFWDFALRCWKMIQEEWRGKPRFEAVVPQHVVARIENFAEIYTKWVSNLLDSDDLARGLANWLYQGVRVVSAEEGAKISGEQVKTILETLAKKSWYRPDFADREYDMLRNSWDGKHGEVVQQYIEYRKNDKANPPAMLLYRVLIGSIELGNFEVMQNVFDDWFKYRGHPSAQAYKALLKTFALRGEAAICEELFEQFASRIEVDASDYVPVLNAYVKRGDMVKAVEKLEGMSAYGLVADLECYNMLMRGFAWAEDMESAMEYLEVIMEKGFEPNDKTFTSMMYVCAIRGDFENVELLFRAACQKFKPTAQMWNMVVWAHVNGGARSLAWKIVNFVVQQNMGIPLTHMYNMLMSSFANHSELRAVNRIFKQMQTREIPFDFYSYTIMMRALVMTGNKDNIRKARQMLDLLQSKNIQTNGIPYFILMQAYLRRRRYADIFAMYKNMLENQVEPDFSTQSMLLMASIFEAQELAKYTGNVDLRNAEEISRLAIENFSGYDPTSFDPDKTAVPTSVFTPLVSAYIYKEDYDSVRKTYQKYLDASGKDGVDRRRPGMNLLLKLLHAALRERNWVGLREMWTVMYDEARRAGRPLTELSTGRKIVAIKKRTMCPAFDIMTRAAIESIESAEWEKDCVTVPEVAALMHDMISWGFELDGANWNTLIVLLAKAGDLEQAFRLAENLLVNEEAINYTITDQARFRFVGWTKHARHPHLHTVDILAGQINGLLARRRQERNFEEAEKARELVNTLATSYPVMWKLTNTRRFRDKQMEQEEVHRKFIDFAEIANKMAPVPKIVHEYHVPPVPRREPDDGVDILFSDDFKQAYLGGGPE